MRRLALSLILLTPVIGCADSRPFRYAPHLTLDCEKVASEYRLRAPDVLRIEFPARPEWDCLAAIDLDGHLNLSESCRPMVEGLTIDEARQVIVTDTGEKDIRVQLEAARGGKLFVRGPELHKQITTPYIGPERVVDALIRLGTMRPGESNLRDVWVIRPNVASGMRPEVVHVNWTAVENGDHTTNILLEPSDIISVGETRRSSFSRMLPQWALPAYRRIMGLPQSWFGSSETAKSTYLLTVPK